MSDVQLFAKASETYPLILPDGSTHNSTVYLKNVIDHPNFVAGDYSYASRFGACENWQAKLAPYLFPFSKDHLEIGKFCQIAHGAVFITSSANHAVDGFSSYPFQIFDRSSVELFQPDQRDISIGHDCWIGYKAMICAGATIGNGVIIGAGAVVRGNIPDYALVMGNPAQVVKFRFDEATIKDLLEIAWWNWPIEKILAARHAIENSDIEELTKLA